MRLVRLAHLLLILPGTACGVLDVNDPDIIDPDDLNTSAVLPTIRASALGDFAVAYAGAPFTSTGQILLGGLLADELVPRSAGENPDFAAVNARNVTIENSHLREFLFLSQARRAAEAAAARYRALAADTSVEPGLSEMLSLAGYTYVLFAEHWCSGIPFSTATDDGTIVFGQPLTTTEVVDTALERFNHALAAATALPGSVTKRDQMLNLARVGRGRGLLDQGDFVGAAGAVALVPTEFAYLEEHSSNTSRQNNGVYVINAVFRSLSVADLEGGNGLPFRSAADPRVPWALGAPNFYLQVRYPDEAAPVPIATGVEARLIEAEAFLRAGDTASFVAVHDALRASPPSYFGTIPPLVPLDITGLSADEVVDLHFRERAFWLWLTAHRLGDLRRLARQYGRDPETIFPTGTDFAGGRYGADVNFPVPFAELNNPNFTGCLDRLP